MKNLKFIYQYILELIIISLYVTVSAQIPVLKNNEGISLSNSEFVPNAKKAIIFSIIPGLGQIYNQKYWKLPIVYAGFSSCLYVVCCSNKQYHSYKNAYLNFIHNDNSPLSSVQEYKPKKFGDNIWDWEVHKKDAFSRILKNGQNLYRKYRDLSFFCTNGLYILSIVDAYVDAQLFYFDIDENLSFRTKPALLNTVSSYFFAFGLQCKILFNC